MADVLEWLGNQVDANDPVQAGMDGAVRLATGAAAMSGSGDFEMAFGLQIKPELRETMAPLVERAKTMLDSYVVTLAPEELDSLHEHAGRCLEALGMGPAAAPPATATHRVTLRYPLVEPALVDSDTDEESPITTDQKRCFDGVRPLDGDDIADLPCFSTLGGLVETRVSLGFEDGELWCDVELDVSSEPTSADLEALQGPISSELWNSGWALNLDWEDTSALEKLGVDDESFVNLTVSETPKSVSVAPYR